MPFQLDIHNLKEEKICSQVLKIIFVSEKGQHTLLPGHASLFTILVPSTLIYEQTDHIQKTINITTRGFLKFAGIQCDIWIV